MAEDFTDEDYNDYWYGEDVATFGDRLAAARHYAGLSQEDLARRMGVKLQTAMAWEDDIKEPRATLLMRIAGLLNVSVSWLLTGEGEGVETAPGEEDSHVQGLAELLTEVRDIRGQLKSNLDQLARLEKKLRLAAKESEQND